jgi:cell division protein FtsB
MSKYIPVDPEKWAEMVKAMGVVKELNADIDRLRDRYGELCAENDRLKAEVKELTGLLKASTYYNTSDEVTRLKAEVERLTQLNDTIALRYDATKSMLDGCAKEIEEMEAEAENSKRINTELLVLSNRQASDIRRLTKAGDVMAIMLQHDEVSKEWNAAKEGKPTD